MLDTDHGSTDDLSIALTFGGVLTPNLGPEDLCAMKDFEILSTIDFYLVRNVRTLNDCRMVTVPSLHEVDPLVDVRVLMHLTLYLFLVAITNKS
jgi:hypothetical protein